MATCSGRVGSIIARVRALFNADSTDTGILDNTEMVAWINLCQDDLARAGAWKKEGDLSLTADTETYTLTTAFSDYVELHGIRDNDTNYPLISMGNYDLYKDEKLKYSGWTSPAVYYVDGVTLYISPTLSANDSNRLSCFYSYRPTDLGCTSAYTPEIPSAFDQLFVDYVLWCAYERDRHAVEADRMGQQHLMYYLNLKNQFFKSRNSPRMGLRPYR